MSYSCISTSHEYASIRSIFREWFIKSWLPEFPYFAIPSKVYKKSEAVVKLVRGSESGYRPGKLGKN